MHTQYTGLVRTQKRYPKHIQCFADAFQVPMRMRAKSEIRLMLNFLEIE